MGPPHWAVHGDQQPRRSFEPNAVSRTCDHPGTGTGDRALDPRIEMPTDSTVNGESTGRCASAEDRGPSQGPGQCPGYGGSSRLSNDRAEFHRCRRSEEACERRGSCVKGVLTVRKLTDANGARSILDWDQINWQRVEQTVRRLQQRIFMAKVRGDQQRMESLQRLLASSWSAKLLAVRKVAQENDGRKTP